MDSLWGSFLDSKGGAFLKQKKLVTVVIGHLETSRSWGVYVQDVFKCVLYYYPSLSSSQILCIYFDNLTMTWRFQRSK